MSGESGIGWGGRVPGKSQLGRRVSSFLTEVVRGGRVEVLSVVVAVVLRFRFPVTVRCGNELRRRRGGSISVAVVTAGTVGICTV
jgi:hypothetical protein